MGGPLPIWAVVKSQQLRNANKFHWTLVQYSPKVSWSGRILTGPKDKKKYVLFLKLVLFLKFVKNIIKGYDLEPLILSICHPISSLINCNLINLLNSKWGKNYWTCPYNTGQVRPSDEFGVLWTVVLLYGPIYCRSFTSPHVPGYLCAAWIALISNLSVFWTSDT